MAFRALQGKADTSRFVRFVRGMQAARLDLDQRVTIEGVNLTRIGLGRVIDGERLNPCFG